VVWINLVSREVVSVGAASNAVIHPDRPTLFLTRPDHRGDVQIWSVDVRDPESAVQLTFLARGVGDRLAVSRDGRYVLASTRDDGTPRLVLVAVDGASAAP
jgi:WD40 repeat protein